MKSGFFQRYRCLIVFLAILVIAASIVLGVVFGVVIPNNKNNGLNNSEVISNTPEETESKDSQVDIPVNMNVFTKPDLSKIPQGFKEFNDSTIANSYSVPLDKPFPYQTKKIRGVNLGGWLVPEPFIAPSLYTEHTKKPMVDEWTLCEELGKKKSQEVLSKHYDNFVTEEEIKELAESGLNHIRIPVGYWMFDIEDNEPFVYGSWMYLLRGIQWCRKYGLRVMIDFHAAPGSQNGWNHSGRVGEIRFLNQTNSESRYNEKRFLNILIKVAKFFNQDEFKNVVTMIGVVNEPNIFVTKNHDGVAEFYKTVYESMKKNIRSTNGPILVFHDAFEGIDKWVPELSEPEYTRVIIDTHTYIAFDNQFNLGKPSEIAQLPCKGWRDSFYKNRNYFMGIISGEFSLASNDCGFYLNGVGAGSRYDGTAEGSEPACPTCTCSKFTNYQNFTRQHKDFLKSYAENQMDAYEAGSGWFFWNFKTENGVNPAWDYQLGLRQGWIPKNVGVRTNSCKKELSKESSAFT